MNRVTPTINTQRLTLRGLRAQDFDRYAEIWSDEQVVVHIGGQRRSRDESWNAFLKIAGHWQITGFGQWAIEDHVSKRVIGQTGFFYGARGYGADFDAHPEAGWVLAPETHGNGFGREAAFAAHDWFDRVITGPLVCQITPENGPSHRLADALGYVKMGAREDVDLLLRKSPPQRRGLG
ncbi:MAG: GNAT family N-acetyltransferase [Pseudomonadota bacterium]